MTFWLWKKFCWWLKSGLPSIPEANIYFLAWDKIFFLGKEYIVQADGQGICDLLLNFRFDEQIAKISISSLQCEPYKDVSLSTRFGELNETVIKIKSELSSLETNTDKRLNKLENHVQQSTEGVFTLELLYFAS